MKPYRALILRASLAAAALLAVPRLAAQPQSDAPASLIDQAHQAFETGGSDGLRRAMRLYDSAAVLLRAAGDRLREADVLNRTGFIYYRLERPDSSIARLRQALCLARGFNEPALEGQILGNLASVYRLTGAADSALAMYRAALRALRASDDAVLLGHALTSFADVMAASEQRDSALFYHREALHTWTRVGNRRERAGSLAQVGHLLWSAEWPDSALVYFREALDVFRQLGDTPNESTVLHHVGGVLSDLGLPDSAIGYLRQALGMYDGSMTLYRAASLADIGVAFSRLGESDSALAYHRQSFLLRRQLNNPDHEARAARNLAAALETYGEPDSAAFYLRQALALEQRIQNREGEAATLQGLGAYFGQRDQLDSALVYTHAALRLRRELRLPRSEAATLNSIGNLYGNFSLEDSAAAYRALALQRYRDANARDGEAEVLSEMSSALIEHAPDSARTLLRQVLGISLEIQDPGLQARALTGFGDLQLVDGRPDSAVAYYRRALQIRRGIRDRQEEARSLHNISETFLVAGNRDSALYYLTLSLPLLRQVKSVQEQAVALANIGYLHQLGLPHPRPDRAAAYYDSAAALHSQVRQSASRDLERTAVTANSFSMYPSWALAWLARAGEPDVGEASAALAALAAVERGRARALLDLMHNADPGPGSGADMPLEGQAHVQAARRSGAALSIVYLATKDTLVTWVVSGTSVNVLRRAVSLSRLEAAVDSLRGALGVDERCDDPRPRGDASYTRWLQTLSALMLPHEALAPMPPGSELLVVADGPLHRISFAALLTASGEPLGTRFGLRYAPSLATLAQAENRPRLSGSGGHSADFREALVAVNPLMPRVTMCGQSYQLMALPDTEPSARGVAERLGATLLTGRDASESRVRQLAPGAPVIHLATHAYAYDSDSRSRDSFIALAPENAGSAAGDGLLTLAEIVDELPELRAELVTLAACDTGSGGRNPAEGTIGLQRGLLARGARTVLVSLWVVEARATGMLMDEFYRGWLEEGLDKAEALRQAQARVRGTPGYEHPRYWAAFQLVGAR